MGGAIIIVGITDQAVATTITTTTEIEITTMAIITMGIITMGIITIEVCRIVIQGSKEMRLSSRREIGFVGSVGI